jgi:hypothetical protein
MMLCADSRIRIWRFATGKLRRSFDESMEVRGWQQQQQQSAWQQGMSGGRLDHQLSRHTCVLLLSF